MLVGYESISLANNPMFDIMIQRAKTDVVMIRIMTQRLVNRAAFLTAITPEGRVAVLSDVSETLDGFYFHNPANGSTHAFLDKTLKFPHEEFIKFTEELSESEATGIITVQ